MNSKLMALSLAPALVALVGIAIVGRQHPTGAHQAPVPTRPAVMPRSQTDIPLHIPYEFLFRRIKFLTDRNIPDGRLSALLQEEFGINAKQAERLKQVALLCLEEVGQQDGRAETVIAQRKARYPGGIIRRGQEPPPSPELAAMQLERNAMFLRARASMQGLFSPESFERFDYKVKSRLDSRPAAKKLPVK